MFALVAGYSPQRIESEFCGRVRVSCRFETIYQVQSNLLDVAQKSRKHGRVAQDGRSVLAGRDVLGG